MTPLDHFMYYQNQERSFIYCLHPVILYKFERLPVKTTYIDTQGKFDRSDKLTKQNLTLACGY